MQIPTFILNDQVNIYDRSERDANGVWTGGSTIVAGSVNVLFCPLEASEAATIGGGFDRTRIRCLGEPTLDIQSNAKVVVVSSAHYAANTTLIVEGDPQVLIDPANTSIRHHKEAILVLER